MNKQKLFLQINILNRYYYKNLEESEIVQWPFLGEGIVFDQLKEPTRVWTADRHADQPIVVPFKKFASKIGKVTTPTSVPSHAIDSCTG